MIKLASSISPLLSYLPETHHLADRMMKRSHVCRGRDGARVGRVPAAVCQPSLLIRCICVTTAAGAGLVWFARGGPTEENYRIVRGTVKSSKMSGAGTIPRQSSTGRETRSHRAATNTPTTHAVVSYQTGREEATVVTSSEDQGG